MQIHPLREGESSSDTNFNGGNMSLHH